MGKQLQQTSPSGERWTKTSSILTRLFFSLPFVAVVLADKVILFMSDGDPTDLERDIALKISTGNFKLGYSVVILTYAAGGE